MNARTFIVTPHGVIELRDWAYHDGGRPHYERRWTCACGDSSSWVPIRHPQCDLLEDGLALHAAREHSSVPDRSPRSTPMADETSDEPPHSAGASAARSGTPS